MTIFDELDFQRLKDTVNKHSFKLTILTIIKGYFIVVYFKFQNTL
uniref:Uncharacterized protein n=1 Tax=Podoviridae sp. ctf5T2 TaxID=2827743 RepID=A0A8S5SM06_9CAUD|nr:MAG TPA: hypothetical protein [Podoviridae sp. ctf5T2]